MDQQVQHVITLSADLEASFHPVQPCGLEKLRRLQLLEQVAFGDGLGGTTM